MIDVVDEFVDEVIDEEWSTLWVVLCFILSVKNKDCIMSEVTSLFSICLSFFASDINV